MMINHIDQWITEISSNAPIIIYIWCQYHKYSHIFAWFAVTNKSICFKEEAAQKQEEVSEVGQMTKKMVREQQKLSKLRLLQQKVSYYVTERQNEDLFFFNLNDLQTNYTVFSSDREKNRSDSRLMSILPCFSHVLSIFLDSKRPRDPPFGSVLWTRFSFFLEPERSLLTEKIIGKSMGNSQEDHGKIVGNMKIWDTFLREHFTVKIYRNIRDNVISAAEKFSTPHHRSKIHKNNLGLLKIRISAT